MAFREIKPVTEIDKLFEPEQPTTSVRGTIPATMDLRKRFAPSLPPLTIPAFPQLNKSGVSLTTVIGFVCALALIWVGATTSGTFYGPASGKFAGILATIFYQYQLGTMLEFFGILILWDIVKRFFSPKRI